MVAMWVHSLKWNRCKPHFHRYTDTPCPQRAVRHLAGLTLEYQFLYHCCDLTGDSLEQGGGGYVSAFIKVEQM